MQQFVIYDGNLGKSALLRQKTITTPKSAHNIKSIHLLFYPQTNI